MHIKCLTNILIHYTTNAVHAASEITDTVHALEMISPEAPNFILGDFNSFNLLSSLPTFKQCYMPNLTKQNTWSLLRQYFWIWYL